MDGTLVLVIDDDPVIARLIKLMLGTEHYEVVVAQSVAEALSILKVIIPDVICCDLMMPEVSGLDFLEKQKTMPTIANVPVVVISGVGKQDWFDHARQLGASICLSKPFNAVKLIDAINFALRSSQQTALT